MIFSSPELQQYRLKNEELLFFNNEAILYEPASLFQLLEIYFFVVLKHRTFLILTILEEVD